MELIIAILFFSICGAVCLRLFARAHQMNMESAALNHAVTESANIAELVSYDLTHDSREIVSLYTDAQVITDDSALPYTSLIVYYDSDWNTCEHAEADYSLQADFTLSKAYLAEGTLSVADTSGAKIYELPLKVYVGSEAAYE